MGSVIPSLIPVRYDQPRKSYDPPRRARTDPSPKQHKMTPPVWTEFGIRWENPVQLPLFGFGLLPLHGGPYCDQTIEKFHVWVIISPVAAYLPGADSTKNRVLLDPSGI